MRWAKTLVFFSCAIWLNWNPIKMVMSLINPMQIVHWLGLTCSVDRTYMCVQSDKNERENICLHRQSLILSSDSHWKYERMNEQTATTTRERKKMIGQSGMWHKLTEILLVYFAFGVSVILNRQKWRIDIPGEYYRK